MIMILRLSTIAATLLFPSYAGLIGRPAAAPVKATGESCDAAKDLIVQALEHLKADSPNSDIEDANRYLARASDLCAASGDAWYFRSVVEAKLGHAPRAAYALRQAKLFPGDALRDGLNPFVLATPTPDQAAPLAPIRKRWALIVGIGTFSDSSFEPLEYTRQDAEAFRDVLTNPHIGGFEPANVKLVTDENATTENIKESLNWLARSAAPEDLVVVYIAAHGSEREADTAGANYIITHDTKYGAEQDPDKLYGTALPMTQLAQDVATRFKSRRTAIFLDTCYSGGAIKDGSKPPQSGLLNASVSKNTLDQISQGSGRVIFGASSSDQQSWQSPKLQHGYFTYYLIQTLKAHPSWPLTKVYAEVRQNVTRTVAADKLGTQQTPVLGQSSDSADFPLGIGNQTVAKLEISK